MKVLILEDEALLMFDLAEMIEEMGHEVIGPFAGADAALKGCASELPGVAILDFNLGETSTSEDVADFMMKSGVPFAFTTGYGRHRLPVRYADATVIEKPYGLVEIASFLDEVRV